MLSLVREESFMQLHTSCRSSGEAANPAPSLSRFMEVESFPVHFEKQGRPRNLPPGKIRGV